MFNRLTLTGFNAVIRAGLPVPRRARSDVSYEPFLFPLDMIGGWNKIYGPKGFFQYQCVVPPATMRESISAMLARIAESGQGSFLAVLKTFGKMKPPGLISFPMEGATLALDFPNKGKATLQLMDKLDAVLEQAGGRLYPAKDGRMSAAAFQRQYPAWQSLAQLADPQFSSSFWRRVTGATGTGAPA
jgi:FAD/FMN-containing dehydrogenase